MNEDFLGFELPFSTTGLDFSTGQRGIDLNKFFKESKKSDNKKIPTTVRELSERNEELYEKTLADLGGSTGLVPVIPTTKKVDNFFTRFLPGGIPIPLVTGMAPIKPEALYGTGELEVVDGKLVGKDRPTGLAGKLASISDAATFGLTDFDKLGGGLLGSQKSIAGYGGTPTDYKLTKSQKDVLKEQQELEDDKAKGPLDNAEERLDFLEKNYDRINQLNRKMRTSAALDSTLQYAATEPIRQAFLNRAAEQAAQRGLRIRGALEAMPSNIQNIMSAKQQQQSLASLSEAERQRATAAQQDAATRFAGLGMQRRFG